MQVSIARQLGLQPSTVGNFFMNARRRLHDKWQNSDYDNEVSDGSSNGTSMHTSAKLSETNNNSNTSSSSSNAVTGNTIMILDSGNCYSGTTELMQNQQQPHDLSFALEAIESIEQPPQACSDSETEAAVVHAAAAAAAAAAASAAGVYSLTSL